MECNLEEEIAELIPSAGLIVNPALMRINSYLNNSEVKVLLREIGEIIKKFNNTRLCKQIAYCIYCEILRSNPQNFILYLKSLLEDLKTYDNFLNLPSLY